MVRIGEDQVRRVKEATDIVQVMSEYAAVRKSGKNFVCCCPFHQERSPSCYIYTEDPSYYCFGCKAHGDAISLVQKKENVSFVDAVEILARRAGITLVLQEGPAGNRGERDALVAAAAFATSFYERCLWEAPEAADARAYLESRRLGRASCERFRLGWSLGRGSLVDAARRKGLDLALLAKLDLTVDRDGRLTDRFYERVMFPICDRFGNPIAFSGRLLPAAEKAAKEAGRGVGKYVNNTDTPLYQKGHIVFNLHRARTAARDAGRLIVMEGPTDVMAADQAGYAECVAVLGTALTPEHARQLNSVVGDGRLILLLDGDRAGQTNALKGIRTCLAVGAPVKVAILPDELDPAELLAAGDTVTPEAKATFERVLAGARSDVDHLLRTVAPRPYDLDREALVAAVDEVLGSVRPMPDEEQRRLAAHEVAEWFNVPRDRMEKRLAEGPAPRAPAAPPAEDAPPAEIPLPKLDNAQDRILQLLVARPTLRPIAADEHGLEPSHVPPPWDTLLGHLLMQPEDDFHAVQSAATTADPRLGDAVGRLARTPLVPRGAAPPEDADLRHELALQVRTLRRGLLRTAIHRLGVAIQDAERARDMVKLKALFSERSALQREERDLG